MESGDYAMLANLVLITHAAYVAFVLLGLPVILVGAILDWRFVRNFWLRLFHLAAIGVVVVPSWFGIVCPLTTFESTLRARAGASPGDSGFIAYWLRELLYYEAPGWVFVVVYTAFGLLVVASWYFVRPAGRRQKGLL